jgi:hypothetical protein
MSRKITVLSLALMLIATLAFQSSAFAGSAKYRVRARLFGETPMKGQARYEQRIKDGQTFKRFKVQIEKALPLQTFDVLVNGSVVGAITTNSLGRGKFELRTAAFIDSPGDGLPMPADFPKLDTGDSVSVGPLTGTIYDLKDKSVQRVRYRGEFDADASGKADYRERYKKGKLERRFKIEIEDVPAGQSLDLYVNDLFITTIATAGDETEFQLRTAAFIDSPGDGLPMPNSFPSIKEGDVVKLGDYEMIMERKN